jgi:hypothetical protein
VYVCVCVSVCVCVKSLLGSCCESSMWYSHRVEENGGGYDCRRLDTGC